MRTLPAALAASVASGVTTLATCWRLQRADGLTLGFTDCDQNLTFGGVTYKAQGGMSASSWARSLGLSVDTLEAVGALTASSLTEADLTAGLWDDAALQIWRVDWSDTTSRVQLFAGSVGQVSRGNMGFRAEMRGLSHYLNQDVGRVYARGCDASLGDSRCTVNVNAAAFKGTGTVVTVSDARLLTASGLGSFASGLFSRGRLTWSTGANAGLVVGVFAHRVDATAVRLELSEQAVRPVVAGDTFVIRAGCDKQAATCLTKFANLVNFRGFPHMPGNDVVFSYITTEQTHDGGSFFK